MLVDSADLRRLLLRPFATEASKRMRAHQHATAAKSRLRRTAGQTRSNDLAFRAEKLPGYTFFALI
jgi:hypothetical protein